MDGKEIKRLQEYVKKRYDEVSMDYQTFNCDIDTSLSFAENKTIIDEYFNIALPKVVKKKDIDEMKAKNEAELKAEREKQETEAKAKEEAEIERIKNIPNSVEEENIFKEMDGLIRQLIVDQKTRGILIHGASSLGKTFRVRKAMINNKMDYVFHNGHTTEMRFYIKCFENANKIHIFDDENILKSKTFLNMIKAMLNGDKSGRVEYDTSKKFPSNVLSSFDFTGKVVIILNELPKNDEHFRAVKNRMMYCELQLDRQQRLNLLYERAKNEDIEGTTKEERIAVVDFLKDNTDKNTLNLNYRLYEKAINFYIHQKDNWKELTKSQIDNIDEYTRLIIDGLDEPKEWCEKTGKSLATYYRHKIKARKRMGEVNE